MLKHAYDSPRIAYNPSRSWFFPLVRFPILPISPISNMSSNFRFISVIRLTSFRLCVWTYYVIGIITIVSLVSTSWYKTSGFPPLDRLEESSKHVPLETYSNYLHFAPLVRFYPLLTVDLLHFCLRPPVPLRYVRILSISSDPRS